MPHIIIEHSSNVKLTKPAQDVLAALHETLASMPSVDITAIKSRIIPLDIFRMAGGAEHHGFVHLRLDILAGREVALRQQMGEALLKLLISAFLPVTLGHSVNFSLEVREMERETYFKHASTS